MEKPKLTGVPDNRQHEPGYWDKLGKEVAANQPENQFKAAEEKAYKEHPDSRTPQERDRDANIVAELRKSVFPDILIDADALAYQVARYQKTRDYFVLKTFFEKNSDPEVAKKYGKPNGMEALKIILDKLEEMEAKEKKAA